MTVFNIWNDIQNIEEWFTHLFEVINAIMIKHTYGVHLSLFNTGWFKKFVLFIFFTITISNAITILNDAHITEVVWVSCSDTVDNFMHLTMQSAIIVPQCMVLRITRLFFIWVILCWFGNKVIRKQEIQKQSSKDLFGRTTTVISMINYRIR